MWFEFFGGLGTFLAGASAAMAVVFSEIKKIQELEFSPVRLFESKRFCETKCAENSRRGYS
ncbi:hypothetical protein ROLI_012270 [Roseobacter fucihabitans]|uniref:Uncharacterized protein n=1 Tax=Roseobacter fucihabitans TaxID=1537242 RepID=A0ABZ2BQ98_9RHOB|nr:hypothetical protein [Roseobacter litoralis]